MIKNILYGTAFRDLHSQLNILGKPIMHADHIAKK